MSRRTRRLVVLLASTTTFFMCLVLALHHIGTHTDGKVRIIATVLVTGAAIIGHDRTTSALLAATDSAHDTNPHHKTRTEHDTMLDVHQWSANHRTCIVDAEGVLRDGSRTIDLASTGLSFAAGDDLTLDGDHLVQRVEHCTCGQAQGDHGAVHADHCGTVSMLDLSRVRGWAEHRELVHQLRTQVADQLGMLENRRSNSRR